MISTRGQQDMAEAIAAAADSTARPQASRARRHGPRLALLCGAAAIVLLGAAAAGVFGYLLISRGSATVTGTGTVTRR